MRRKTCCFTGHRDVPKEDAQAIIKNAERKIRELVSDGYLYFGVGGAIGFDTIIAQCLFRLRATEFPFIKVILVYPFDGFTSRWNEAQQRTYNDLLPLYDKVVCEASVPSKGAYLARDRHLVDWSSCCVCYLTKNNGGTAYTVKYAKEHGLSVHNVAPKGLLGRGCDL